MKKTFLTNLILCHIAVSLFVILLPILALISVWYPENFSEISASDQIFHIILAVEFGLFFGLLLLLFFGRQNSINKTLFVYSIVFILQICSAFVGLKTLYDAKPMYIVYEFDRYRIVRPIDVIWGTEEVEYNLLSGPIPYSTLEYASNDIRLLSSIKDSINGLYPAFKKERLIPYQNSTKNIIKHSRAAQHLSDVDRKKVMMCGKNIDITSIGYYPLVSQLSDEWIALINLNDASIICYLNINGWGNP